MNTTHAWEHAECSDWGVVYLRRFSVGVYIDGETEGKEIDWLLTYIAG